MTKRKQPNPRPPKRGAAIPLGRPIDRLQSADRERIRADVAAFIAYVRRRRAETAGLLAVCCWLLAIIYLPIAAGPGSSATPIQPTPTPTVVRPPG